MSSIEKNFQLRHCKRVLPRLKMFGVLHLTKTDTRLANNGIPLEVQKLRCQVNYQALKFTPRIEETGKKIVKLLRQNGPFIVLRLRYEMDMLAFFWLHGRLQRPGNRRINKTEVLITTIQLVINTLRISLLTLQKLSCKTA